MKRFATEIARRRLAPRLASSRCTFGSVNNTAIFSTRTLARGHEAKSVLVARIHKFSTAAAPAAAKETIKKKDDSNIFLDNLGKIFLASIAGVIAFIIRSSRSTQTKNTLRDLLEHDSVLDPVEIDELRLANSELSPEVFGKILSDLVDRYPQNTCSYNEFTLTARTTMAGLKGGAFTVQLGHLMDRVVTNVLDKYNKSADDPLPLSLWLTTLSLALYSSVDERIQVLFEVMEKSNSPVSFAQIEDIVGHLQDTCQLPPDTQIVPTETKYPVQTWERGTPDQLVPWEGAEDEVIDLDAFRSILRSKSVCAWGECYQKKKM
jgi:hypothetical protein